VDALREWLKQRPKPKRPEHEALVFITKRKLSWAKATEDNPISKEFRKLLDSIHEAAVEKATKAGKEPPKPIYRPGIGFYSLRRAFETTSGDAKDQVATDFVMGHCDPSMAAVYRQKIADGRLRAVVDHVRGWLWPAESTSSGVQ
jgi:integrase